MPQHRAVIDAAKAAGVSFWPIPASCMLDTSPLPLAAEHKETENLIRASGLPAVILRNGWYTENSWPASRPRCNMASCMGSAGRGRIASAARADYADAAAAVLTQENQAGRVYQLSR